jgi:hypothetical protein
MKIEFCFMILAMAAAPVFAENPPATPAAAASGFESPGRLEAKTFIAPDLMKGPSHFVGRECENDGFNNTYFLYSGSNAWAVVTGIALKTRIREIYAIEKLKEMNQGKEFTQGIVNSGENKIKSVFGIVTNPLGTVENLPLGASRFFGRIGEALKGGRTEGEGNIVQNVLGVQKAKVALAVKLGVSPYSYNQELQKELTANARATALGGLVVQGATAVAGGPAGAVLTALNVNQTLQGTLVNSTPDDLRIINRKKLFALGVTREDADRILMHPWYSPWTETIMIDALANIGIDPTEFLRLAAQAQTEQDAIYFQRLAQVMSAYANNKTAIRAIKVDDGAVFASDAGGNVLIPLSCDYAIWSESNAKRLTGLLSTIKVAPDVKEISLWVDGKLSKRALDEMKALNIQTNTEVLSKQ